MLSYIAIAQSLATLNIHLQIGNKSASYIRNYS